MQKPIYTDTKTPREALIWLRPRRSSRKSPRGTKRNTRGTARAGNDGAEKEKTPATRRKRLPSPPAQHHKKSQPALVGLRRTGRQDGEIRRSFPRASRRPFPSAHSREARNPLSRAEQPARRATERKRRKPPPRAASGYHLPRAAPQKKTARALRTAHGRQINGGEERIRTSGTKKVHKPSKHAP